VPTDFVRRAIIVAVVVLANGWLIGLTIVGVVLACLWLLGIIASAWAWAPLGIVLAYVTALPLLAVLGVVPAEFGK
jgi:hypothetical protein